VKHISEELQSIASEMLYPPMPSGDIDAIGHRFGADLICIWCGVSMIDHQQAPAKCTAPDAVVKPPPPPKRELSKTCRRGHLYETDGRVFNGRGHRVCMTCKSASNRKYEEGRRAKRAAERAAIRG